MKELEMPEQELVKLNEIELRDMLSHLHGIDLMLDEYKENNSFSNTSEKDRRIITFLMTKQKDIVKGKRTSLPTSKLDKHFYIEQIKEFREKIEKRFPNLI